jgi:malate dehydrogenase
MDRRKVTVVGAGFVGATAAQRIVDKELADVALIDILEGVAKGKALDMAEAGPWVGTSCRISASKDYAESADSDIVVVTAGMARKPGMSREDLAAINNKIVKEITAEITKHSPEAILLMVTNPLDVTAYVAKQVSGWPRERVIGQSGALDSSRFRTFIAQELNVAPQDVQALVIGGHSDVGMVPLASHASVAGIPLTELLDQATIDKLIERTRRGGTEIVELLGQGSAYYAPSAAIVAMVEAILLDQKRIIPSAVYLEGEYGLRDLFLGVPVKLGRCGVEEIIEIKLSDSERKLLEQAAERVRAMLSTVKM